MRVRARARAALPLLPPPRLWLRAGEGAAQPRLWLRPDCRSLSAARLRQALSALQPPPPPLALRRRGARAAPPPPPPPPPLALLRRGGMALRVGMRLSGAALSGVAGSGGGGGAAAEGAAAACEATEAEREESTVDTSSWSPMGHEAEGTRRARAGAQATARAGAHEAHQSRSPGNCLRKSSPALLQQALRACGAVEEQEMT